MKRIENETMDKYRARRTKDRELSNSAVAPVVVTPGVAMNRANRRADERMMSKLAPNDRERIAQRREEKKEREKAERKNRAATKADRRSRYK